MSQQSTERIQRFKAEVADMRVPDPVASRDRLYLKAGAISMLAGIALGVYAYVLSYSATDDPRQQRDAIVLGLIGVAVSVVGTGLFLRGSLTGFLRFWMARLIYEQQAQADRVAEAIAPRNSVHPDNRLTSR
jgi:hypothetical protein